MFWFFFPEPQAAMEASSWLCLSDADFCSILPARWPAKPARSGFGYVNQQAYRMTH
jgi:hypothetical protein